MSQTSSVPREGHRPPRPEASSSDRDDAGGTLEAVEGDEKEVAEEGGEEDMEIDELRVEGEEHDGTGRTPGDRDGAEAASNGNCGEMQLRRAAAFSEEKVYLQGEKIVHAKISVSCSTGNEWNSLAPVGHSVSKDDGAHYPAGAVDQMGVCSDNDRRQMESRLVTPELACRSLPFGMELADRNKRPAIICDFFAKGWCIKGTSCRFLHVKDNPDSSTRQHVEQKDNKHDKGLRDDFEACPPGMLERLSSSSGNSSAFPASSSSVPRVEPSTPSIEREDLSKHDDKFISSYRDVIRNGLGRRRYDEDYRIYTSLINRGSPVTPVALRSNSVPDGGPSPNGSVRSLSIQESNLPSSRLLSHTLNPSLDAPPFAFSSLSNASSLDAHILANEYASCRSASLGQDSPLLSGPGRERYSLLSSNNKRKFSPYNWEPSVPFQPSFSLDSVLSSLGSRYEPFLDSIEQPKPSDGVFRGAGQLISGQMRGHQVSGENDRSGSTHNRISEQVVDKDCLTDGRDSFAAPADTTENSIVDCQNDSALLEENSQPLRENPEVDARDMISLHRSGQARPRKNLKDERVRNKVEKNMHHSTNVDDHKESKLLRHFRCVLIDFVKALLRPHWEGGRLTKDAHNLIVKKAVDKVVSTLTNEQVPTSKDSMKHYLSLSEAKIAKLVEGYVDKYGKPSEVS